MTDEAVSEGDAAPASNPFLSAPSISERTIRLPIGTIRVALFCFIATISYLGLCAELWEKAVGLPDSLGLVDFLSLSDEANLPTWAASLLHGTAALLLAWIGASREAGDRDRRIWLLLAFVFVYISIDETVQLHEHMNSWFDWGGALYFGWVVPAGALVLLLAVSLLGFLRRLPNASRVRMVTAAVLFVGGAIGIELILGWWTDAEGSRNLGYALIDWVEESLEFAGIGLFVYALIAHLATPDGARLTTEIRPGPARTGSRRLGLVLAAGCAVGLLGAYVLAGGFSTLHLYQDHRGFGPSQDRYQGPDLRDVLRGGTRFKHTGTVQRFDRDPGPRALVLFALGAGMLTASYLGSRRRPD